MRMSTPHITPIAVKERKVSQSASCKIDSIVRQLFLPMLGMPTPERTSFLAEDMEDQLLRQVAQERPGVLATEVEFVDYMVLLYRKFQRDSGVSDWVSSSGVDKSNDNHRSNEFTHEYTHEYTQNVATSLENVTSTLVVARETGVTGVTGVTGITGITGPSELRDLDSSDDVEYTHCTETVNFEKKLESPYFNRDTAYISSQTSDHKLEDNSDLTALGCVESLERTKPVSYESMAQSQTSIPLLTTPGSLQDNTISPSIK